MVNLSELRLLVRRFVDREISYAPFHAQFVADYLSVLHRDSSLERSANAIESLCADFDEGDISEPELRDELSVITNAPIVSVLTDGPAESRSSRAIYITSNLQPA